MKTILIMAVLSSFALAQGITASGGHMTKGGKIVWGATGLSSSHVITANFGGLENAGTDSGNANFAFAVSFLTPATCSPCSVTQMGVYIPSGAASAAHGTAIYTDNGNTPVGGTEVCGGSSTITPTNANWNVNVAGYTQYCNGTNLSPGTVYWAASYTASNTENQGTSVAATTCPYTNLSSLETNSTISPWPGTWPASTVTNNGCYNIAVSVQYTSTASFDIISFGVGAPVNNNTATVAIFPFTAGHRLRGASMVEASGGFTAITSMTDSASDTITTAGSTGAGSGNYGNAFFTGDSITTGANTLTFNWGAGCCHPVIAYMEVADPNCSSSCYNTSGYDTAFQATPFTSATPTGTLANATELCFGAAWEDTLNSGGTGGVFAAGSGWTLLNSGQNSESVGNLTQTGVFQQITSTTTAVALKGSYSGGTNTCSGSCVLPSVACWK